MELLKLLSTSEIVAQIISFLILFFLLRVFAWKKLLIMLDARREKIAAEFKKIEDTQQELKKTEADYEAKLNAIEDTARSKIQEAINEGRAIAQEIRKKAQSDALVTLSKAKENIDLELSKAKEELKEEVVNLTLSATEHMLKEKITPEKDARLVTDFLKELEEV